MSSTVPSIDSEEYRIEKENRMARTLAKRRVMRDEVEIKYYNEFCNELNDLPFIPKKINSIELLVNIIENLRDDVAEKILEINESFNSILPLLERIRQIQAIMTVFYLSYTFLFPFLKSKFL